MPDDPPSPLNPSGNVAARPDADELAGAESSPYENVSSGEKREAAERPQEAGPAVPPRR
jgi:hypothetical protein